ncbi:putative P-loop containing nucleoside triphosphate hydrolase, leucine-rich repeat domain superfamily [Helianthus annuus]|nr:putative P-loop containing nucleoside triphosphate hydrolase, leucine-rich repeat domain superfamily [Helianthus annuus]
MDAIINSIVTPVVESLMVPVKKHLGFLVSSTKHVKAMKEELDQLNVTEQDIQEKKTTADANYHVVSRLVSPWFEDVQKMKEKAQSIPTAGIGCFNVAKRYKAGKQSCIIVQQTKALKERASEISWTNEQKSLAKVPSTSAPVPHGTQTTTFESRDSVFNAALQSLQSNDESQKMIALCGMGGVGKTTMMEQLKKAVEDSKMFDWVVKVVLGESTDPFVLQQAVAEYIHQDLSEKTIVARAELLRKKFEGMSQNGQKKILVLMDDIWKEVDLKDVGLTSPLPNGFKLLFTSRFEPICTRMGGRPSSIFRVGVLHEEEAKTLFFEIVRPTPSDGDDDDEELQKIGENIVKKCGGLPIALKTIANSLNGNIKEAWKKVLKRLEKADLKDLESITYKIFEISYENLKEGDDKAIFLLSALFPDDFNIRTEDLFRLGWGLGFLTDGKTLGEARSDMKICVNNLLRANLLTKSDRMGCVKMHDLVRAFVLNRISEVKQASIVNIDNIPEQYANETYERILLKCTGMTEFPSDFNYPNLSLLMLMDGDEVFKFPEDIYKRMEKLEVLSYEDMHIPLLPQTSEHSTKLRTLCLRSCSFINDDVSFLGSLSNLETLSFVDCGIRWLPSTIGKLRKLKLLDLTGCVNLRIDDGVFQDLHSLEELYMRRAYYGSPIRFTDGNCDELEKLSHRLFALELEFFDGGPQPRNMSFKNLERFRISIGCKLVELKDAEKYSFKNTIVLSGDCHELIECKINVLFEKTEELYLKVNEMNNLEDVSVPSSFSNLRVLDVCNCEDLKYLFTVDVANGLKELERLTISECHGMRTLVAENSRVGVIRFRKLIFLSLSDLPEMVSLWDNVIELPEMVQLKLHNLPNFTSIYPESHNTAEVQSLLNKKVVTSKLNKLDISSMENLKQIWPCQVSSIQKNNASMLKLIKVKECCNLINIFPSNPLPLVSNLEELEVSECGSVEMLFNMDFESLHEVGEYGSSALRRIKVDELGKLKEVWRMKGVNDSNIHINCFKGVESIEITECKSFTNIFTPATTNFDLGALTNYVTDNTGEEIKGEISEMDDDIPNVTYPSYLLHNFHHLQHLKIGNDKRVEEVVFEMDSQQPLLPPYLQTICLRKLNKMSRVWKCNWNRFLIRHHPPLQFPFQNLTDITLILCPKIKYLFSPLMSKYLSNLKHVCLEFCDGIEEVISRRDDENEENTIYTSSHQNTTLFPCLDTLKLNWLPHLKCVDDGGKRGNISSNAFHDQSQSAQVTSSYWSLCQYPTKIFIADCDALSSLIPWYAAGQMNRLQELVIDGCERLMDVFESESSANNVEDGSAHGGAGITLIRPTLRNTIIVAAPQLSNLKTVCIDECDLLPYIFTFNTLESLKQLKELRVTDCKAIQVIVKEDNTGKSSKGVVFPRLETLKLTGLPNLKGFFLGMNDFRWPSLDNVVIDECPQLMMLTSGQSTTPKLKYIRTWFGKCSLERDLHGVVNQNTFPNSSSELTISEGILCSIHNLIEINIEYKDLGTTIVPSNALLQLEKLQQITMNTCHGLEEVFEVVAVEGSGSSESKTVVPIPNLTHVKLDTVYELKYLWKSNHWMVIVKDEEEEECDAKVNEIILPRLNSLKLQHLESLKGFCLGKRAFLFPRLETLQINKCPAITVFTKGHVSTPQLKVTDTTFWMWNVKPDLNSFIKTKQGEGYKF